MTTKDETPDVKTKAPPPAYPKAGQIAVPHTGKNPAAPMMGGTAFTPMLGKSAEVNADYAAYMEARGGGGKPPGGKVVLRGVEVYSAVCEASMGAYDHSMIISPGSCTMSLGKSLKGKKQLIPHLDNDMAWRNKRVRDFVGSILKLRYSANTDTPLLIHLVVCAPLPRNLIKSAEICPCDRARFQLILRR